MIIKKYGIYWADFNPRLGEGPAMLRPVAVVQTDLLNGKHPTTLVCPLTTRTRKAPLLRISVPARQTTMSRNADIMVDQLRAIDNRRFIRAVGKLTHGQRDALREGFRVIVLE